MNFFHCETFITLCPKYFLPILGDERFLLIKKGGEDATLVCCDMPQATRETMP